MDTITIAGFAGANLADDDLLLPLNVGVQSLNQRPGYADLRPWNAPGAAVATVPTSPQRKTIYRMGQDVASDSSYWLSWSTVVNVARGFDTDDTTERTYFTGSGTPKWTNNSIGISGGPPYPQATRELAVPAPTTPLTATLAVEGASGTEQSYLWVYTWVNDIGWESAPSPVSNTLLRKPGSTFNLAGFDTPPAGNYGINKVRLYRFVAGSGTAGDYFFEREWALGSTPANPISDGRAVGSDPLATLGWLPPPADGKGLLSMWNGMLGMGSGKSFRICEPYKPYAWPLKYEVALTAAFVAAGIYQQRVVILTTGDATVIAGSSPDGMDEEDANINRPCSSAAGVVEFNEGEAYKGIAWPSEDGLAWVGDGGFRNLTEKVLTREQWKALNPASMVAGRYNGFYVCSYDDGTGRKGFVLDPKNPAGIYFLTTGFDACAKDPISDKLFVLEGGSIKQWNAGAPLTATFRSKVFELPEPANVGAVEVVAKGWPVQVKVWGDGVLRLDRSVTSGDPVRLPAGWMADQLQLEVSSSARVVAVRMAETIGDLARP